MAKNRSTLPDVSRTRVNTISREPLTARLASSMSCCRIALFSASAAFFSRKRLGPVRNQQVIGSSRRGAVVNGSHAAVHQVDSRARRAPA